MMPKKKNKREERLTTFEISEMNKDDFNNILGDINKCGRCSECLAESGFADKRYTLNGRSLDKTCATLRRYLCEWLCENRFCVKSPKDESRPSEEGFYSQTKNFMRKRGYDRCYMCGADLKGGDKK